MRLHEVYIGEQVPYLQRPNSPYALALADYLRKNPGKTEEHFKLLLPKQQNKYLDKYLEEVNVANLIKAAALAGTIAMGSPSLGATDVNTGDKPQATRQYSIMNQQANDIISRYHHTDAGNRSISGSLAPHNILDNTAEGKLLSDIKSQMNQRWNPRNDPKLEQNLYKYVNQQGLVYFVYHLLDTDPQHPFVSDIKEY